MSFWAAFAICLLAWAMVALSPTVMPAVSASAWPPSTPPYFITEEEFNKLLPYREDDHCPSDGFYTYSAFVTAARAFPKFGREGDLVTRKREIAAFLAQTAAETTGGCYVKEPGKGHHHKYCAPSIWPCVKSRKYFGRGPLQLRWNKNYGDTTAALRVGLLEEPDLLLWNATLAYETGIWFWMTPHSSEIPSCHDVIVGNWKPSARDVAAGRLPGYGVISNILASTNGKKQECGFGWNKLQASRIDYYIDYCAELGIVTGDNIDCYQMVPFNDPPPQLQLRSSTDTVM